MYKCNLGHVPLYFLDARLGLVYQVFNIIFAKVLPFVVNIFLLFS